MDIRYAPSSRITYVHLLMPGHQILFAEGAPCESLLCGDMAKRYDPSLLRVDIAMRPARPILSFAEAIALGGARPKPPPPVRSSVDPKRKRVLI